MTPRQRIAYRIVHRLVYGGMRRTALKGYGKFNGSQRVAARREAHRLASEVSERAR